MANDHYLQCKEKNQVDWRHVVMPSEKDIFKACRLLWHAISRIRNGIPDGQHRIAAMMKVLENWSVTVDPTKTPPKTFVEVKTPLHQGKDMEGYYDTVLKTLKGRATTCLIFPTIDKMEQESMQYSLMREVSQSHHKPRMFKDM